LLRYRGLLLRGVVIFGCLAVLSVAIAAAAGASTSSPRTGAATRTAQDVSRPGPDSLTTAVYDPDSFTGAEAALAFARTRNAGATAVRITVDWQNAAHDPLPSGSDPTDPGNPGYGWSLIDDQVQRATAAGLSPILSIFDPPSWARDPAGNGFPTLRNPAELGDFFHALARRYSGSYQGLPRVRYYEVWNEPNHSAWLDPQYANGQPASPALFRQMVNAVADAVHSVHSDNLVVAGGLSPFTKGDATTDPSSRGVAVGPLRFMADLLCMSSGKKPKPTCNDTVRFDIWSHHPYTYGSPDSNSTRMKPDDVWIGNLPRMKTLLDAAVKAGHVQSSNTLRFWVTEFSWDSSPPDPRGVPAALEAEWVSEALYNMWRSGVDLVTWFLLRDSAPDPEHFESGLYQRGSSLANDAAKPALAAFRFPFIGQKVKGKLLVWGRTPPGRTGDVVIEESDENGGNWQPIATVQTNANGIFQQGLGKPHGKYVRAVIAGELSVPFPEAGTANLDVSPFGG
jgi:hypothetical protein